MTDFDFYVPLQLEDLELDDGEVSVEVGDYPRFKIRERVAVTTLSDSKAKHRLFGKFPSALCGMHVLFSVSLSLCPSLRSFN
jgi:hypothetical protein